MYIYIHTYVSMYVSTYFHVYTHTCIYIQYIHELTQGIGMWCIYKCAIYTCPAHVPASHEFLPLLVYTHVNIYTYIIICIHRNTYIHIDIHVYTYIYIYICTYLHTHKYIHVHTQIGIINSDVDSVYEFVYVPTKLSMNVQKCIHISIACVPQ